MKSSILQIILNILILIRNSDNSFIKIFSIMIIDLILFENINFDEIFIRWCRWRDLLFSLICVISVSECSVFYIFNVFGFYTLHMFKETFPVTNCFLIPLICITFYETLLCYVTNSLVWMCLNCAQRKVTMFSWSTDKQLN